MPVTCKRDLFSLPTDHHYLNCAYMSPLSDRVRVSGIAGIERKVRPWEIEPSDFFSGVDRVRSLFGRLVNAPAERIAVIPAVSYGMAVVARNLDIEKGQNVVTVHHQYPSNVYPWRRGCDEVGASIRVVDPPTSTSGRGAGWSEGILDAIDSDTALVALGLVHWTDGTRFDVSRIAARAREVGAALVIDGTQAIGAAPFDVAEVRPDALVCAGYKWLTGPYSIGVAYFGERFDDGAPLEETWIAREGSDDFNGLVDYQDAYRPGAVRYDVGEPSNFTLIPMLTAGLEQIQEWGVDNITAYCRSLTSDLIGELADRGYGVEDEAWRSAHLFGLRLPPGVEVEELRAQLAEARVFVSARGGLLRISPHVYNDEADLAALRAVLCS